MTTLVLENQLKGVYSLAQADQRSESMTRTVISQLALTEVSDKPALRDLSVPRRVLHLIWESVWPYEIVWNSEEKLERLPASRKHLHAK